MTSIRAILLSEERLKLNKDAIIQEARDQLYTLLEDTSPSRDDAMEIDTEQQKMRERERERERFSEREQRQLNVSFLSSTHLNWPTSLPLQFLNFFLSCPHIHKPPGYEGMDLYRIGKNELIDYLQTCNLFTSSRSSSTPSLLPSSPSPASTIKSWEELKSELKKSGYLLREPNDDQKNQSNRLPLSSSGSSSQQSPASIDDPDDQQFTLDSDKYYYFSSLTKDNNNTQQKKSNDQSGRTRIRRPLSPSPSPSAPPSSLSLDHSLPSIDTKNFSGLSCSSISSLGNNVLLLSSSSSSSSSSSWSAILYPIGTTDHLNDDHDHYENDHHQNDHGDEMSQKIENDQDRVICFPSRVLPWIPSLSRYEVSLKDQSLTHTEALSTLSSLFPQFFIQPTSPTSPSSLVAVDGKSKYVVEYRSSSFDCFFYYQFHSLFSSVHSSFLTSPSLPLGTLLSATEEDRQLIRTKLGTHNQMIILLDSFSNPDLVFSHCDDDGRTPSPLAGDVAYEGVLSLSVPILKVSGQRISSIPESSAMKISPIFYHEHLTHTLHQLSVILSSLPFQSTQFFIYIPWNYLLPSSSSSSSSISLSPSLLSLQKMLDEIVSLNNVIIVSSPLSLSPIVGNDTCPTYIPCCRSDVLSSSVLAFPSQLSPSSPSSLSAMSTGSATTTSSPLLTSSLPGNSASTNSSFTSSSFLSQVASSSIALSDYGSFVNFFYLLPVSPTDPLYSLFSFENDSHHHRYTNKAATSSTTSLSSSVIARGAVDGLMSLLRVLTKIWREKGGKKLIKDSHSLFGEIVSTKRLLDYHQNQPQPNYRQQHHRQNKQLYIEYKVIEDLTEEMLEDDIRKISEKELERRIEQTIRALEVNRKLLAENEKALRALRTQETGVGRNTNNGDVNPRTRRLGDDDPGPGSDDDDDDFGFNHNQMRVDEQNGDEDDDDDDDEEEVDEKMD